MEQTVATDHTHRADTEAELEQFDEVAMTGWTWFTKFLLWNVIACVVTLLVIGLFTVWS